MTFREAQLKLLAYLLDRIHNGELTERGLARLIGVSQPHAHNVLKGVRNFSPDISDTILKYFKLSLLDLASVRDLEANLKKRRPIGQGRELPFLDGKIGPCMSWPATLNWRKSYPLPILALSAQTGLVFAELAWDPFMDKSLAGADIALLDTSDKARSDLSPLGLYVIDRSGEAVIRHVRPGARGFYLVTDAALDHPALWERLVLPAGHFAQLVKARLRWVGRYQDRGLPQHQRGRLL